MSEELRDGFGRTATDLRLSVTDRCNFRCTYCMPATGLPWLPRDSVLSFEEITRLVRVFIGLGVRSVRLTGGEPLVRPGLDRLVTMLVELGTVDLSMTTNGFLLARHAEALAQAGLRRVNVSIDSLLRHRFAELARRDALDQVMDGLLAAERAGLSPIKLNCVVVRGTNDDEVVDFARLARATGYQVRFIEVMPLDGDEAWSRERVVPAAEVLDKVRASYPLVPVAHGAEPATLYRFADGSPGRVGAIPSVTEPFCASCDRLRLTADGQLRTCLFATDESDLKAMVRSGASDEELRAAIRTAVAGKWAGHAINEVSFTRPSRSMSMIGG